jgi:Zn-dependent protease with chaperone function
MNPDLLEIQNEIQNSAKALAIFAIIPIVLFQLWADSLSRYLDEMSIKKPKFDRKPEVEKVRLAGLLVILLQSTLFLVASDVRGAYPFLSPICFITVIMTQLWTQSQVEKKLQASDPNPDDIFKLVRKAITYFVLGILLYGTLLIGSIGLTSLFADSIHASRFTGITMLLVAGGLGVLAGLGLNFALGPFYLKSILPLQNIPDAQLQIRLEKCFSDSQLTVPDFRVIELNTLQMTNVIFSGFQKGRGMFRATLFLTRPLLNRLNAEELEAVILNQVSQTLLKQVRRRFIFSLSLVAVTTIFSILSGILGQFVLPGQSALEILAPAVALASFSVSFSLLSAQAKRHEFEADIHTVEKMGVSAFVFIQSLRKLCPSITPDTPPMDLAQFDNERRIDLITQYFAEKNKGEQQPEDQAKAS